MENKYEPQKFEKQIYKNWLKNGYFHASVNYDKPKYSVCMPPPNVTGKAHMGHALDNTIQDILVRFKRMQGYNTLWVPGTDHAAIATEAKIVSSLEEQGLSKDMVGRTEFIKRGFLWYEKYGNIICDQLSEMGISCDWNRKAFTMDDKRSQAVRKAFVTYYKNGLIYRGTRVVNWCPHCKSSISDIENVYKTQNTFLWHIRYPFADGSGAVIVATTRPETIFGDTAVAVNPKDERYKNMIGKMLVLPLTNRQIPLIADDYCEIGFGTGAVKITPAHDPNDYLVGQRHNLEVLEVIDADGKLNKHAGEFEGLDRLEARSKIEKKLKSEGYLVKVEKYKNNVGTCIRCGTMTEPRISDQWYVKMKELAKPAIEAVKNGKLKFHPKKFEKKYLYWLENIQDWCISRQLWLGHRIPVFTCKNCGCVMCEMEDVKCCTSCGSNNIVQDNDVLDTWFSSALWPFSTLGWPEKTDDLNYFYPTNTLVTGPDIITFWVVRMVFSGIYFMGDVPFSDVVIHGIMRDSLGRKMSKNLGNGIDPLDVISQFGADSMRLSVVNGTSMGLDMRYDMEDAKESKIFINKLYNASKFVLANIDKIQIKDLSEFKLDTKDKWILCEMQKLIKSTIKNLDKFAIGLVSHNLIEFTVSKFCDWYLEMAKVDLYGNDSLIKNKTANVLLYLLTNLLKLFHPFIPFVTEYIYQNLPNHEPTIMLSSFPVVNSKFLYKTNFEKVIKLIQQVRKTRAEFKVPDNKRTALYVVSDKNMKEFLPIICKLAGGTTCEQIDGEIDIKNVKIISEIATVIIPMNELVDLTKEKERLQKEIMNIKFEIERSNKMLSNSNFVTKAPKELVEKESCKLQKNKEILTKLEDELTNTLAD